MFSKRVNVFNINYVSGKFYDLKSISVQVGADVCKVLPFFPAFNSCDNVSSFYNPGKCRFFDTCIELNEVNGELTE